MTAPTGPTRRPPTWVWLLAGAVVCVLAVAALLVDGRGPDEPTAAPSPAASTPTGDTTPGPTDPSPTDPTPPDAGEDEGGFLDGLVQDLLGGVDADRLARCVGVEPGGTTPLPDDVEAAIDVIAEQVAAERGLAFDEPVDLELLDAAALRDRVVELTEQDYTDDLAAVDEALLTALGAIDEDTDLRGLQVDLLGDQVAGFYDPSTGELVALTADGLDAATRITVAHELEHALADQALGLPDLEGYAGRSDELLAAQALIEGDATLLMQRWALRHLSLADQLGAATTGGGQAAQLAETPYVLRQQLLFAYTTGLSFACDRFVEGGWPAVDAAYADPPTTTAQVLWPTRYRDREAAVDVPDPQVPLGFAEDRRDQLGAADLLWLFQAPGDDRTRRLDDADERARAWAGGELVVGRRDDERAVGVTLAEHPDAPVPLCDSVATWFERTLGDDATATPRDDGGVEVAGADRAGVVACDDGLVRLAVAPDARLAAEAIAR